MTEPSVSVLFSDLDGTLVHYPKDFNAYAEIIHEDGTTNTATMRYRQTGEERKCHILTSMTGGKAYISLRTKELIQKLRDFGVIFVIITGARTSTYMTRRPLLPTADFEIFENGGRMLRGGMLDASWTDRFIGQVGQIADRTNVLPDLPAAREREGSLWGLYRMMVEEGWKADARDYTTNFRVDVDGSKGKTEEDLQAVVQREVGKRGLATSFNLGKADFYPGGSGKGNAAKRVLEIVGMEGMEAVAMFDDDNDIELGDVCGMALLPGVTHRSVLKALESRPGWVVMERGGVLGSEMALERIVGMRERMLEKGRVDGVV